MKGLDWQNNNSARASRFFVHFFPVTAQLYVGEKLNFTFCGGRRLQNKRFFFLKTSKEIGKAWRNSLTRASDARRACEVREKFLASLPSLALCFQPRSTPFV